MEIIAVIIFIAIVISVEVQIYKIKVLPNVEYDCFFSKKEVLEGETLEIIETVINPSPFWVPCMKSEITTSKYLAFAENVSTTNDKNRSLASLFDVKSKQKVRRAWKAKCFKRGVFKLEDTTIIGVDLFGYYHYSNIIKLGSKVTVLPRPIDISEYVNRVNEQQGDRVVKRFILEDPFEIAGVREYTTRDSMNKIHWGITARQGQLMVRNNEATSKKSLTILFNNQLSSEQLKEPMHDERLENGIRIAAGEIGKTIKTSTPVRLLANGGIDEGEESIATELMWGPAHVHELFVLLSSVGDTFTEHFDKLIRRYETTIQSTEVIIITCYIDEPMLEFERNKRNQGIKTKFYLLSYEKDSKPYEDLEVYYLLDYLKEVGETNEA